MPTLHTGEIDYDELRTSLAANAARPAIINVNIGTTVKGAVDDLDRILDILRETGYTEDRFYIHCDGALFGLMIPFVKKAPLVTFRKPIGSISVSGHKFIGVPVPCGVVITRTRYVAALSQDVEYLNSRDATIMGSRNGHAPIYMWYTLTRKGYEGMRKDVERCLRNAHLLKVCGGWRGCSSTTPTRLFHSPFFVSCFVPTRYASHVPHTQAMLQQAGVPVMLNELSSTVVFERPRDEAFVRKWQLACEGDIAHVVVMPNIGLDKLEAFVADLISCRARTATEATRLMVENARALEADEQ